jgi:hypothetical protein
MHYYHYHLCVYLFITFFNTTMVFNKHKAESFVGNATGAAKLFRLADTMSVAMNQYLWCTNTSGLCDSYLYPTTTTTSNNINDELGRKEKKKVGTTTTTTSSEGDHFMTQWNGFNTPTPNRDFMDYDANLMACAHGVPNDNIESLNMYSDSSSSSSSSSLLVEDDGGARAKRILARIDAGQCRPSATFVSERYYGKNDVTNGNVGDSW